MDVGVPSKSPLGDIGPQRAILGYVGIWMQNDLCWLSFFLWSGVGGRSCSNFLASTASPKVCDLM